jgi:hypothetical protein
MIVLSRRLLRLWYTQTRDLSHLAFRLTTQRICHFPPHLDTVTRTSLNAGEPYVLGDSVLLVGTQVDTSLVLELQLCALQSSVQCLRYKTKEPTFDAATWKVSPEIGRGVLLDMRE